MRLCRRLSFDDVLKCSLGLSNSQANTLKTIVRMRENFTVDELAKKLKKDRSIAQRHLSALGTKGVVFRLQRNRNRGGYEYVYRPIEKTEMKRILKQGVKQFTFQVETMIKAF